MTDDLFQVMVFISYIPKLPLHWPLGASHAVAILCAIKVVAVLIFLGLMPDTFLLFVSLY